MQWKTACAALAATCACHSQIALAATLYVNGGCGNDAWSGTSPTCAASNGPKKTIQAAINAAASNDTILVADGMYSGTGNFNLLINKKVKIHSLNDDPSLCSIDCLSQGGAATFFGSDHSSTELRGFTITGAANGSAIVCTSGSPTLQNCIITGNVNTSGLGGGVYCGADSSPRLLACVIQANVAGSGGGVHVRSLDEPTEIRNCAIILNLADQQGGGIDCDRANVNVIESVIDGNAISDQAVSYGYGGGANLRGAGTMKLTNCVITDNYLQSPSSSSLSGGGGVAAQSTSLTAVVEMTNCLVARNGGLETFKGGGAYNWGAQYIIINCTFVDNQALDEGGAYYEEDENGPVASAVTNSVFWGNEADQAAQQIRLDDSDNTLAVEHSDVEGGQGGITGSGTLTWGSKNISADPAFVNSSGGNYQLVVLSPARNRGDTNALPCDEFDLDEDSSACGAGGELIPYDLDAPNPRFGSGAPPCRVDMGAYENQETFCAAGDINDDGCVDIDDLFLVIGQWDNLSNPLGGYADIAPTPCGNGQVDIDDLFQVIADWGPACPGATCGTGGIPESVEDCMDACALDYDIETQEWSECVEKCACTAEVIECD